MGDLAPSHSDSDPPREGPPVLLLLHLPFPPPLEPRVSAAQAARGVREPVVQAEGDSPLQLLLPQSGASGSSPS